MVTPVRIAVIGVGPRGLSALERVVSHARRPGPPIELVLVEPGTLGVGIHQPQQPDYLLLNTICSQLTIFSDPAMTPGAPVTRGPSLHEWSEQRSPPVRFDEYLPRRQLGEYLQWAAREILDRTPARLTVEHRAAVARDVRPTAAGAAVTLSDGIRIEVDLAIVTTGHGLPAPAAAIDDAHVTSPYPLPERVAGISPGATVALLGTGLTAMDAVAALTVGRGGAFRSSAGGLRYVPSEREPTIVLANRSGWLPCARPATRADRRSAPARYLRPSAVAALRRRGRETLDFRRDVEPLIRKEALSRMGGATMAQQRTVLRALSPTVESWTNDAEYRAAMLGRARADLREAEAGLGTSVVKEALEVLRDHRESLRAAIDAPGLTPESHRYFFEEYVPVINRIVIGPQKERIHELLALIEAGVVVPAPGPAPTLDRTPHGWRLRSSRLRSPAEQDVDVVVRANLTWPDGDDRGLTAALRSWCPPGPGGPPGLGLDRDGYAGGRGPRTVAVFGPPAEGSSYYNHYVPSPGVWSRALTDLDRVIVQVVAGERGSTEREAA
jgi:FAD-NAD(P)-binding